MSDAGSNPNPNPNPKKASVGSKFKGVLPQPNGNWGAQIYMKQQRIWLGTFRSEIEAAMAYDSAAVLFRNAESPRNLPCTFDPSEEQRFQSLHFQKDVLSMIKDGSYHSRFEEYLRARAVGPTEKNSSSVGVGGFSVKQLFQKELTLSDVGKLNRLVIPKKYAEKHLPKITEHSNNLDGIVNGVDLVLYDESMRSWCFRYCYWSSSQSYVFTKGWSQFVKEKGLILNDVVTFYRCENVGENRVFYMIGISRDGEQIPNRFVGAVGAAAGESNVPAKAVGPIRLFGVNIDCSRV